MGKLYQATAYLNYLRRSSTRYRVHSPFIFRFVNEVLRIREKDAALMKLLAFRGELRKDRSVIVKEDFGSGRLSGQEYPVTISRLAGSSSGDGESLRLLYRIVQYFRPGVILELGTSLGFSSMAMALANPDARVYTLEGSREVAGIAESHFKKMGIPNITLQQGEFREQLPEILKDLTSFDLAYLDGDHRKESTISYYEMLADKRGEKSLIVLDDIHWSKGMAEAWDEICRPCENKVTIDLYHKGLVFFREGLSAQHYILRY